MVAREVSVIVCDQCAFDQREERDAVESIDVSFDSKTKLFRRIDLCEECASDWRRRRSVVETRGDRLVVSGVQRKRLRRVSHG